MTVESKSFQTLDLGLNEKKIQIRWHKNTITSLEDLLEEPELTEEDKETTKKMISILEKRLGNIQDNPSICFPLSI